MVLAGLLSVFLLIGLVVVYFKEVDSKSTWTTLRRYITVYPLAGLMTMFGLVITLLSLILTEGFVMGEWFFFIDPDGDSHFSKYWDEATITNKCFDVLYSLFFFVATWYQIVVWTPILYDKFV